MKSLKFFLKKLNLEKKVAQNYDNLISKNSNNIIIPHILKNNNSVYAQYTIRIKNRKQIINNFKRNKIPYSIYYPIPAYKQKVFSNKNKIFLKNVEKICKEVLSIPMHPYLTLEQQNKIVNLLK